jgi:hypothetical protein
VKLARPALALVALSLTDAVIAADWAPQITAAATWDDNVTNANRADDRIGALDFSGTFAIGQRTGLTRELALLYGAQVDAEAWPRFDGLDRVAAGPTVALRYKNGLGPTAPTLTLRAAGSVSAADESGRAGPEGNLSLTYDQGLTDTTRVTAGIIAARLAARDSVFTRGGVEGFMELSHDLDANWRLLLSARWRDGDVLSYATPPRPDLVNLARVRVNDATFGRPMVAYSLQAHTVGGTLALTRALDAVTSLKFGFEWRETTREPLLYVNRLVSLSVTRQF